MTVAPHILRRYVIDRASGRTPRHEWAYYAPDLAAWIRTDETAARRHEHWRRIRKAGQPWCDVMGHQTAVADDLALRMFFLTVSGDDWPSLAAAVREHSKRCLRDWTAAGQHLMAAVTGATAAVIPDTPGPLDGWPAARGDGPRSLLPR
ncbi:hypothetical protein GGQ85_001455 [Nitrobacter vulgaris]|uniref:Uncharacterized protein n=1 Tax=Nitrobacter vulgaris TaxID=29421 RepID=A0A1V4I241_NITVU|nr:hypothetical protein [Nitrobacter vulgaris]MDR6303759.1 hypothetical protein [Nitrobacter vulgaris]OPH84194.1 hypothetical protein B2M20_02615 [Nitrobacter vulgaris]